MKRSKIIVAVILTTLICLSIPFIVPQNPDESDNPLQLFASEGIVSSSVTPFILSDDLTITSNTTIYEIGNIEYTKELNRNGFGFEVLWKDEIGIVWITATLKFEIPSTINVSQYQADITFYVDAFSNITYNWQFEVAAIDLRETTTSPPSFWKNGISKGNETLEVNSVIQEDENFTIAIIDGFAYASFSMIVESGYNNLSKVLITFGDLKLSKLK